ncbi:MAG: PH domain-containing protein [Bacillota bacterium]
MANCVKCGASNLGMGRTDLIIVDETWYCQKCLKATLGNISCDRCGNVPFRSGEHFKTIDNQMVCTDCMEKAGIMKKYDYVMSAVMSKAKAAKAASPTTQAHRGLEALGTMKELLEQNLEPGEKVEFAVVGNTGEALACSSKHLFILKSGMASGSLTGKKCIKYRWNQITGAEIKEGALYGLIEIQGNGLPSHDVRNISQVKQAENAVTFLMAKKADFEEALRTVNQRI